MYWTGNVALTLYQSNYYRYIEARICRMEACYNHLQSSLILQWHFQTSTYCVIRHQCFYRWSEMLYWVLCCNNTAFKGTLFRRQKQWLRIYLVFAKSVVNQTLKETLTKEISIHWEKRGIAWSWWFIVIVPDIVHGGLLLLWITSITIQEILFVVNLMYSSITS